MRRFSFLFLPLLLVGLVLTGCDSTGSMSDDDGADQIEVPATYTFQSRFVEGESAVAYPGQVTRNLLISDIKALTDQRAGTPTRDDLFNRYEYDAQNLNILLSTDPAPAQSVYPDIATGKSLSGKATASYSDVALIGVGDLANFSSGATADVVIRAYLDSIATNYADGETAPEAYTTAEGVDMGQIVNKLLLGAVAYSQGTAKYLEDVLTQQASPNTQDGQKPYSTMGHVWDEAYGYYGAARDFSESGVFYDANGLVSKADDRNGDGEIDLESEVVFTWADYSVDRGTVNGINFHIDLFESFREGRTAIINQASIDSIRAHAADARSTWDDLVASNVVHYLNAMESDVAGLSDSDTVTRAALGSDGAESFNEHWGEAKPFAWALQYNPDKKISDSELESLHQILGGAPPYGKTKAEVVQDINDAKALIKGAYQFPDANMNNW
ncbi:DUF4856 domain-containing protein [Longibacter salinarum]|nr:DUF4856 domain-containing protein [Longibacter salinarum]